MSYRPSYLFPVNIYTSIFFPAEDFAEPEAGFLGSIPPARAHCLPQELLGSLRDGSLQSRSGAVRYGVPTAHSNEPAPKAGTVTAN